MTFQSSTTKALLAGLLAASSVISHMIMEEPTPYSVDAIDSEPLGSGDWPCKKELGFKVSKVNDMKVGETYPLKLKGSAVHGGGSCQMSVTLDKEPTADSVFKVIHSMEGACPGTESAATPWSFKLPPEIPNGEATIAWTWFSKLSGAPELYMNCGRIQVSGGASDTKGFEQLPDMFVANIDEAQCITPQGSDTQFPDPGSSNEIAQGADLKPPTGASCGKPVKAPSGGSPPPPESSTPSTPPPSSAPVPPPASSAPAPPPLSSAPPVSVAPEPTPSSPPTSGSGSGTTSCSSGATMLCNGPSQFGLCDNGSVVWQAVAPGTQCVNGAIQRKKRF